MDKCAKVLLLTVLALTMVACAMSGNNMRPVLAAHPQAVNYGQLLGRWRFESVPDFAPEDARFKLSGYTQASRRGNGVVIGPMLLEGWIRGSLVFDPAAKPPVRWVSNNKHGCNRADQSLFEGTGSQTYQFENNQKGLSFILLHLSGNCTSVAHVIVKMTHM